MLDNRQRRRTNTHRHGTSRVVARTAAPAQAKRSGRPLEAAAERPSDAVILDGLAAEESAAEGRGAFEDAPDAAARQTLAFSLVIPAHNEEARLPETLRSYARAATHEFGDEIEILVVVNGSTDRTATVAESMLGEIPGLRVVDIADSIGKGGAVIEGLRRARGARVAFADADGATDPESLLALVRGLDDHDVVIGSRRMKGSRILRQQPLKRRIVSRLFNRAVRLLFGLPYPDTQCGAKALTGEAAHRLAAVVRERWWAFDLDLLLSARRLDMSIAELPVTWADQDGSQLQMRQTSLGVATALAGLWLQERAPWIPTRWTTPERRDRPRRILALNWRFVRHPEAGGAELNLFEQARRWRRDGHSVTVVSARRGEGVELPPEETVDGIRVVRMGGRYTLYPLVAWFLTWHGHEYDQILDVANGLPFFSPLFTSTPSVLLVHHVSGRQWFAEFPRPVAAIGAAVERCLVPLAYRRRRTIAVSPTTRDALVETGFRPDQVTVVYNGTPISDGPGAKAYEVEPPAGPTVTYVGRLKRYKRLDTLIEAVAPLRLQIPDLRLAIAGDGDALPELRELTARLGLEDFVTFYGRVDDETKAVLLDHATVFATPSMQEGWGLSVLEANARGCPAVAFDVPGLRSAIVDGETGLLASDEAGFRDAIVRLVREPGLRARMSENARRWAARFDWDATAEQTLEILDSAAGTSQSGRSVSNVA